MEQKDKWKFTFPLLFIFTDFLFTLPGWLLMWKFSSLQDSDFLAIMFCAPFGLPFLISWIIMFKFLDYIERKEEKK